MTDDSAIVRKYGLDGAVVMSRVVRGTPFGRPVTTVETDAAIERLTSDPVMGVRLKPVYDRMPLPTSHPAFGWSGERPMRGLSLSGGSRLWVLHHGGYAGNSKRWTVLTQDLKQVLTLESPEDVDILDARGDSVLVHRLVPNGEEFVELRALRKIKKTS